MEMLGILTFFIIILLASWLANNGFSNLIILLISFVVYLVITVNGLTSEILIFLILGGITGLGFKMKMEWDKVCLFWLIHSIVALFLFL